MVDTGQIKFNPAVELSYLASEEQKDFLSAMDYTCFRRNTRTNLILRTMLNICPSQRTRRNKEKIYFWGSLRAAFTYRSGFSKTGVI